MIIFRISLYLICIFSISWSALVFLGPPIIKRIVVSYTDGSVEISNVKLSPTLDVTIGRLDFDIQGMNGGNSISGFSRSTEINWSLMGDQPFLIFDLGPTVVKDFLTAKNIKMTTQSFGSIDWGYMLLDIQASGLNTQMFGMTNDFSFSGNFNRDLKKISNINFNAKTFSLQNIGPILSVDMMTGEVDQFDLTKPLRLQASSGFFTTNNLLSVGPDFNGSDIVGRFKLSPAVKNLSVELLNVGVSEFGGNIDKIKFVGDYDSDFRFQNISLNLQDGFFNLSVPSFSNISMEITKSSNDGYDVLLAGGLSEFEMYQVENYLGLMPPSNFKIDLKLDSKKAILSGRSKVNFESSTAVDIDLSANVILKLNQFKHITDCLMSECEIMDLNIDYLMNVDDEWVKGRSNCSENPCDFEIINHSLTTSNTANIFSILNRSGILNPLSSLYFYTALTSGQKINDGHRLKF